MSSDSASLRPALERGLAALNLSLSDQQCALLLEYLSQLARWNQAYNLSGIKDIRQMLALHLLDSLALQPYVHGERIADVGTGAGLPGFVLAIANPDKHFVLIDSNSKKTRFIFQTASRLGINNIEVAHCRVQDYASAAQVDIVTSRAFASLADFVTACQHLLKPEGVFLAMKGQYPAAELASLPDNFYLHASHALQVPGVDGARHVLEIRCRQALSPDPAEQTTGSN